MNPPLTDRQSEVLEFIVDFQQRHGFAASIRDICEHFEFASTNAAQGHLLALEKKGRIKRMCGGARSIAIVSQSDDEAAAFQRLEAELDRVKEENATLIRLGRIHVNELRRKSSAARALECADIFEKQLNQYDH